MKKILVPLAILALIGAGIGYYMYNKPVESLKHKKADVSTSADQLLTEYEADEKTANEKYLGKVVEVNGRITGITNEEGKNKVILETSSPMASVICEMEESMNMSDLKAGDNVKVKGMCTGYLSDVILVQSSVIK